MRRKSFAALLLVGVLTLASACDQTGADELIYPHDPKVVAAAGQQARDNLPAFWSAFDAAPSKEGFTIKVEMLNGDEGGEHIWVDVIGRDGDKITGTLANDPVNLSGLAHGSRVTVGVDQISDWAYPKDGKYFGHFTTRVLLPQLNAEDQAYTREILAATPLEQPAQ